MYKYKADVILVTVYFTMSLLHVMCTYYYNNYKLDKEVCEQTSKLAWESLTYYRLSFKS